MNFPSFAQDEWEFAQFLNLIDGLTIESILEIGVWHGGSLARFGNRFPYATIVGIDPAPQVERWSPEWGTVNFLYGRSQDEQIQAEAIRLNFHRPFDVIWIDGAHDIDAVTDDWEWAKTHTNKAIGIHDIIDSKNPMIEVWQLWDELHRDPAWNTIEITRHQSNNYGIGVVLL